VAEFMPDSEADEDYSKGGYFNLGHTLTRHPLFYRIMYFPLAWPARRLYPFAFAAAKDFKHLPKRQFLAYLGEYLFRKIVKRPRFQDSGSLRKAMVDRASVPETASEESMLPIRAGR